LLFPHTEQALSTLAETLAERQSLMTNPTDWGGWGEAGFMPALLTNLKPKLLTL